MFGKKKRIKKGRFRVSSSCRRSVCCCARGNVKVTETTNTLNITLARTSGSCDSNNEPILVNLTSNTTVYNGQIYEFAVSEKSFSLTSSRCSFSFQCRTASCRSFSVFTTRTQSSCQSIKKKDSRVCNSSTILTISFIFNFFTILFNIFF